MNKTLNPTNPEQEGDYTYWDCPKCDFPICTWTTCPECGWYSDTGWEQVV